MAKYIMIDYIVNSALGQRELPVHWYWPYLKLATDCYRELHFDVLGNTRQKVVDVDADGMIIAPCDFVDAVGVWATGCIEGKKYGYLELDRIDRPNGKIYLKGCHLLEGAQAILEYITDGSDCDAASKVHPYAQKTIETYCFWKMSPNRDNDQSPEGKQHGKEAKKLRGRLNELTLEELDEILKRKTHIRVNRLDWLAAAENE